jgi:hypothetical protein
MHFSLTALIFLSQAVLAGQGQSNDLSSEAILEEASSTFPCLGSSCPYVSRKKDPILVGIRLITSQIVIKITIKLVEGFLAIEESIAEIEFGRTEISGRFIKERDGLVDKEIHGLKTQYLLNNGTMERYSASYGEVGFNSTLLYKAEGVLDMLIVEGRGSEVEIKFDTPESDSIVDGWRFLSDENESYLNVAFEADSETGIMQIMKISPAA